ncbi:hypothetical protein GCM10027169_27860 [Gordonia jinhuaensis]|uniref:Arylsulfotransferase (ASST) n=1 Tax=Gordonia jinhuaensis TaxID=1517702 RepID=A0A916T9T6_9ACTN|nr:arylsulfotransferase family protein [Gordonia jinhuaensis]GGB37160.1 hypothetical protein GCM10011489_26270 [Gordonia jinhuaensis]
MSTRTRRENGRRRHRPALARTLGTAAVSFGAVAGVVVGVGTVSAAPTLPTFSLARKFTVNVNAPGDIFYTSGANVAVPLPIPGLGQGSDQGLLIVDKTGKVLWHRPAPVGAGFANFRTQMYQGKKVLTWWQGSGVDGHGTGVDYIADQNYHVITTLTAGDGLQSDAHEFRLTPGGEALITAYRQINADLSSVGGPVNGSMMDSVASVVDVATGRVLMQWSAKAHVPLTDSSMKPRGGLNSIGGQATYDPYHINSISLDPDGDLLISMRNVNALYDVNIHTGAVKWILGGKHSTFTVGPGASILGQHDAEFADATTVRVFDNNVDGSIPQGTSAIKWIRLDPATHSASLVRAQEHPNRLVTFATGNAQALSDGYTFGSWGTAGHISEFSPTGQLVYDASIPSGTYRAYLDTWP